MSVIEPGCSLTARNNARRAVVMSFIISAGSSKLTIRSLGSRSPRSAALAIWRPRLKKSSSVPVLMMSFVIFISQTKPVIFKSCFGIFKIHKLDWFHFTQKWLRL
jgi:hypothetical protein